MLVENALLDEASLVSWVLRLVDWSLLLLCGLFSDELNFRRNRLTHVNVSVLADEFGWGEFRSSDLEHGVRRMDSLELAVAAEIKVGANGAHVANALDR